MTLEQLQMKAATFDIWSVPSLGAFGAGRACDWVKTGADRYQLQYPWADGQETLAVVRDLLGKWDVSLTLRAQDGAKRQRTLAAHVETDIAAAGLAEAFVLQERRSVMKLRAN
jgi:hypothetical protein